jgi:hypothetical protein
MRDLIAITMILGAGLVLVVALLSVLHDLFLRVKPPERSESDP